MNWGKSLHTEARLLIMGKEKCQVALINSRSHPVLLGGKTLQQGVPMSKNNIWTTSAADVVLSSLRAIVFLMYVVCNLGHCFNLVFFLWGELSPPNPPWVWKPILSDLHKLIPTQAGHLFELGQRNISHTRSTPLHNFAIKALKQSKIYEACIWQICFISPCDLQMALLSVEMCSLQEENQRMRTMAEVREPSEQLQSAIRDRDDAIAKYDHITSYTLMQL